MLLDEIVRTKMLILVVVGLITSGCQSRSGDSGGPHGGQGSAPGSLWKDFASGSSHLCERHHRGMRRGSVPVRAYGFVPPNFGDSPFPHGGQAVDSGCLQPSNPSHAVVWICPDCERDWVRAGRPSHYTAPARGETSTTNQPMRLKGPNRSGRGTNPPSSAVNFSQ